MKAASWVLVLVCAGIAAECAAPRAQSPPPGPKSGGGAPVNPNPAPPVQPQPSAPPNPEPTVRPTAVPASAALTGVPVPAAAVPEQPAGINPAARPYAEILKLKQSGASESQLLARVRADSVNYQLTTAEIQELRDAGVSQVVLEAMLRSGSR
jgi:hypothetical protein